MKKRLLTILLSIAMILMLTPMTAMAATESVTVSNGMWIDTETTNEDIAGAWGENVATISNENGVYTITLHKNITMEGATLPISIGVQKGGADQPEIVLDLNGCTVTSNTTVISNYGNLTIKDSAGTGHVLYNGGAYLCAVNNNGYTMVIEGGTFECQGAGAALYNAAISSSANTNTIIEGGTFEGNGAGALITYGEVQINGGDFNGKYGVVSKQASSSTGLITFAENSTAVVNADSIAFVVHGDGQSDGKINAMGGTFNAPSVAGRLGSAVPNNDIEVAGGTFSASPESYVPEGTALATLSDADQTSPVVYVIGDTISEKASTASKGDKIEVTSGNVEFTSVPDGVVVSNSGSGNVTLNGQQVTDEPVTVCNHQWSDPVWTWTDTTAAKATFTCTKDETHTATEPAEITSAVSKEATCTAKGETTYTAKVTFGGVEYTDQKVVADIDMVPHTLEEVAAEEPTCTEEGNDAYWYCKVCDKYFADKDAVKEITLDETVIPKTAHTYKDGVCTVCGAEDPDYEEFVPEIIKGANAAWQKGDEGLSFTSNAEFADFIKVQVDGKDLNAANYTVKEGSTIVTLKASYLDTLEAGEHKLAIVSKTGTAETKFTIEKEAESDTPKTDDSANMMMWLALMMLAGAGAIGTKVYSRKFK